MITKLLRDVRPIKLKLGLTLAGFVGFACTIGAAVVVQPLHSFGEAGPDNARLLEANDGNLYGTTFAGGTYTNGSVFQYTLAGTFTTLYSFTGANDGSDPSGNLAQGADGNLYGTTRYGGTSSNGTVFRVTMTGTLTTIYTFTGGNDGANPRSGLILGTDGNLYGTTIAGGTKANGTVFQITTNGTFTNLYSFLGGNDGANPHVGLIQATDGGFYGTTYAGGANGDGTIFRITTNGNYSQHYSFTGGNDGADPDANLLQASNGLIYGTASTGGANGYGVVFEITTNGTSVTPLYAFGTVVDMNNNPIDGANPFAGLVQASDGNLYGSTEYGGTNGFGALFKITPAGSFTSLYAFTGGPDGNQPFSDMMQATDGNIYGSTFIGGGTDSGEIFSLDTNANFTALFAFPGTGDGANPDCNLILASDGNLYGTTVNGGGSDAGTIFRIGTNGAMTTFYSFGGGYASGNPMSGLVQAADGSFYGAGSAMEGSIFHITTNGTFNLPYLFSGSFDGGGPNALVVGKDGNLYGTAFGAGANGYGTIFQYPLPSGPINVLHSFNGTTDGANPAAGLMQASDGNFYGTTSDFNVSSFGTIFRISPSGAFSVLYTFTNGIDGNSPLCALMQASDGNLYGTASDYGTQGTGTIYRITTNGVFTSLYSFIGGDDGSEPYAGLVQATDGNLYGTTWLGGADGAGALFKISTNGTFTALYSFTGGNDGADPGASLVQAGDGNLYGTAYYGGASSEGSLFRVVLTSAVAPSPVSILTNTIAFSGGRLNFSFPTTSGQSYTIQQNTNLGSTAWTTYSNFTGAGSLFQIAVPVAGPQDFFRVVEP